ncbi:hypothetical protein H1Z61_05890 [Bacillus aquiflavi]|uniref:RsfA family transcriptional regulator n=1 Tax=Bacillus aquiflavi TaxID=2672567 RepID=A0A6B3W0E9_9BACI|nr:hypothetical protein [Bacillus aquiflavi]MBA4536686.1 hypothetical protein [Bacillus aquiflavi]NEY81054.1 hypothetical protein [Bacillus aquiflavi]UAC48722.1 hypothetical protein K6959_01740 [Bacillus aquiflavi]
MVRKQNNLNGEVWNDDDDSDLAEIVLRKVREGDTVISACREFSEKTNRRRTADASKFRWHTRLKQQYMEDYNIARAEGKKKRELLKGKVNEANCDNQKEVHVIFKEKEKNISIDDIITLMKRFKKQQEDDNENNFEREKDKIQLENEQIKIELEKVKRKYKYTKEALLEVSENYRKLIDALKVLQKAGIQINVPELKPFKYKVNNVPTVEEI